MTLKQCVEVLGVRLIRPEHDPLALARTSSDLYRWDGLRYEGWDNGWVEVPAPDPGDTVTWGSSGMRSPNFGEAPTHVYVPLTTYGDYVGDTMQRANQEALLEDYPDTFIIVGSSERDGISLALPLDRPVDQHLLAALVKMRDDYPVWNDEKVWEVEHELALEAWDQYLRWDVPSSLHEAGVDERVMDELDEGSLREAFYTETGEQPESPHGEGSCGTSVIFPYYNETVTRITLRLGQITEHTFAVRDGIAAAHPWLRLPGLAVPALRA